MKGGAPDPSSGAVQRRAEAPVKGGRARHYLHAGQCFAAKVPTEVTTILGSCVSVCLWDPRSRIGGANHFVLPHWAGAGPHSPRFGRGALAGLIDELRSLGCTTDSLLAKLFGGATLLGPGQGWLGERNVDVARALLEEEGIPVVGQDVGGAHGRKLIFHTDTGAAWVKRL